MSRGHGRLTSTPPPGRKRVADWEGLRVRSLVVLSNGLGTMPAGSPFTVRHAGNGLGLQLDADACSCCGFRWYVSRVETSDVELAPAPAPEAPDPKRVALDALVKHARAALPYMPSGPGYVGKQQLGDAIIAAEVALGYRLPFGTKPGATP